jgi:hypothetical protein
MAMAMAMALALPPFAWRIGATVRHVESGPK